MICDKKNIKIPFFYMKKSGKFLDFGIVELDSKTTTKCTV